MTTGDMRYMHTLQVIDAFAEAICSPWIGIPLHHLLPVLPPAISIVEDVNVTRGLNHHPGLPHRPATSTFSFLLPLPAKTWTADMSPSHPSTMAANRLFFDQLR